MPTDFTVTPYDVEGAIDYERLLAEFGADALTAEQIERFPEPVHHTLRRRVFYAGRDVEAFLDAVDAGEDVSVVTGVGPSGPLHVGHVVPLYFARYLQERAGAHVVVPVSDDEKYLAKDLSMDAVHGYLRENLLDVLAVGFDPDRTTVVIDTLDADAVYPHAVRFAKHLTPATVEAVYGPPDNVGLGFYPAVQATHLLLPQLLGGRHRTLVPVAVDQDPHVRVCRDLAGKEYFDLAKPGALLSRFVPRLAGPGGKMSSSGEEAIALEDDRETVHRKLADAYSGGRTSVAEHRERGGDPEVDVAYRLLYHFFEPDDEVVEDLAAAYRAGDLLTGELKERAADRVADFLEAHRARRPDPAALRDALAPYRLDADERERLRGDPLAAGGG